MKTFALRLFPGQDLKQRLRAFAEAHQIQAGFILTAVGSLEQARIRLANQTESTTWNDKFEIVSLVGTLSHHGLHLHLAIANSQGTVIGGHLDEGCLIYTTAEIVIGESEHHIFKREIDQQTGYLELKILEID